MLALIGRARSEYPRQFWLVFWGMLISSVGGSMIWPFLMVYVSGRLRLPMTAAASLMTLSAISGLVASFIAGPIVDRLGRKWVMVISLVMNAAGYAFMSHADTLLVFAILMIVNGIFNPLYRIGVDAMVADMIPHEKRPDAYSLTRMANNIGVAVGPAVGGFMAAISYSIAFYIAAAGLLVYGALITFFAIETMPAHSEHHHTERLGGYGAILRDTPFIGFVASFTFVTMAAAMVWILLAVYTKQNFGVPESQYGFIPTTNALMVIFFQFAVTLVTKRFSPLPMIALGAFFYTVATAGIVLGQGFWGFWLCMVILTVGEMIMQPTASTYVAGLAPADKRGRYMGLFGLTWNVSMGIGPLFGGILSDNLGPVAIWYGGAVFGAISVLGFLLLAWRGRRPALQPSLEPPVSAV
ncbi:MAG: MFS transporter [Chloroflexi bacterium]|nr:MFS transporter [Chloroflexota bacterium]MCL5273368.1 MFS transporter [Chloroflexota bacterium]